MTTFLIICVLLVVAALLFVVVPLWRNAIKNNAIERDVANLEIVRDQIAEMDADLRNGLLTQEMYEQGKRELQSRLLDEVQETPAAPPPVRRSHKGLTIVLSILVPVAALGLYWKIGSAPVAFSTEEQQSRMQMQMAQFSDPEIQALEAKIEQNPEDADSLFMLAQAYANMGEYTKSAGAYNRLTQLVPQEAQLWADFADVLAMASGQVLAGHPTMLINRALSVDPDNPKANALAGAAAMERGDFKASIEYWSKLQKMVPPGSEDAQMVESALTQAREALARGDKPVEVKPGMEGDTLAGGALPGANSMPAAPATSASSGKERISGSVTLSDALKSKVGPDDLLFILARAESGPPMPLAVLRKQAGDLPLQFSLDDSMAMMPQMKISNYDSLVIVARISKSGQPVASPGDLEAVSAPVKPGTSGLKLVIDKEVK